MYSLEFEFDAVVLMGKSASLLLASIEYPRVETNNCSPLFSLE